jgi:hypothetical protein
MFWGNKPTLKKFTTILSTSFKFINHFSITYTNVHTFYTRILVLEWMIQSNYNTWSN